MLLTGKVKIKKLMEAIKVFQTYKNKYLFSIIWILVIVTFMSATISAGFIRRGDTGQEVEQLQEMLDSAGYDVDIDGEFGPWTERAVKDFQYNNNLRVDGIAGSTTVDKLENKQGNITYTVEPGDNLSTLASEYNTTINELSQLNDLDEQILYVGQELKVPAPGAGGYNPEERGGDSTSTSTQTNNIKHTVKRGESLSELAYRYGTNVNTIKLANNLQGSSIYVGQELVIPHSGQRGSFQLTDNALIWPVMGRVSSPFGYRNHPVSGARDFHSGLDIAVPRGTIIRAAASGEVETADWMGGYGKTVVIRHSSDVKTLYAHNSSLLVTEGMEVNIGEPVSRAGNTGVSTGPHLHFEVLINEEPVNPADYLP